MKFFHLSDLHIGKTVHGYEMWEDLFHAFNQIYKYIEDEKPDAVVVAGDIYDKAVASAKSVEVLDDFIGNVAARCKNILVIAGNHDSGERLDFASGILKHQNVFFKGTYGNGAEKVVLEDEFGTVNFYLMPFIKPRHFEDPDIRDYTTAYERAISKMAPDYRERNVLVAHQNITNAGANKKSDSENITIGMIDNIEASVLDGFDYVALGHLHSPQKVRRPEVRYCGTPVIFSMSEKDDKKSITVVEIGAKGSVGIRTLPLEPLHSWQELECTLAEALASEPTDAYTSITLTDAEAVADAKARLRNVYPNIMEMRYKNRMERKDSTARREAEVEDINPLDAIAEFYISQRGTPLSEENKAYLEDIFKEIL